MTVLRHLLSALWLSLALAILAVVALSHLAPALGYRLVVIAGPSMSPAIPLGAVVIERAPSGSVMVGDVVTVQAPNGVSVTHRVIRIGQAHGQTYLEIRGDANDAPDPAVVPASSVTGVVTISLPLVGFLLAFLAVPTGVLSIVLALAALMFAIWTLEESDGVVESGTATAPEMTDGLRA